MKKFLFTIVLFISASTVCSAQALGRHTYFHVGMGSGENVWSTLVYAFVTDELNILTHSNIFESSVEYNIRSGKTDGEKMGFKPYKSYGFRSCDLFQSVKPSIKLGYISSLPGNFNWGLYGEAQYRYEQFRVSPIKSDDDYSKQQMGRALFGGSAFVVLGGVTKNLHVMVEAGLRYNMGIDAKGVLGNKDAFNDGLTSHYAVKLTGARMEQDFGIYVDVNHFDYLKSDTQKFKNISIGLTYCLTFGQAVQNAQRYE